MYKIEKIKAISMLKSVYFLTDFTHAVRYKIKNLDLFQGGR